MLIRIYVRRRRRETTLAHVVGERRVDVSEVREAIDPLVGALRADGADVVVQGVEGGQVDLQLLLEDASCTDCVMPAEVLEPLFLDALTSAGHQIATVQLDDPRRGEAS
jgi:hypothetical protein